MQSLGKKFPQKMTHLLEVFSTENWHNLNDRKTPHNIFDCQACLNCFKWTDALAVFPTKNPNSKMKAKTKWTHLTIYFKRSNEGDVQQIK